jgi:hypothetical protein
MLRLVSASALAQRLIILRRYMWVVPRSVAGVTTLIILMPAHLTAITARTGSPAASSSALAHGLAVGMDARGAGAGVIRGAAGAGVHAPSMAIAADTDTVAASATRAATAEAMATAAEPMAGRAVSA